VDRHEDPDVVAGQGEYIPKCFKAEIREHVWVQLPLETYTKAMELTRKQSEPRKKRKQSGEVKPDAQTAKEKLINKFNELLTYHFEKEGKPYAEAHVDMVHTYSDSNNETGLPKLDDSDERGWWLVVVLNASVRPTCDSYCPR
jgi:hypothetical protein